MQWEGLCVHLTRVSPVQPIDEHMSYIIFMLLKKGEAIDEEKES